MENIQRVILFWIGNGCYDAHLHVASFQGRADTWQAYITTGKGGQMSITGVGSTPWKAIQKLEEGCKK